MVSAGHCHTLSVYRQAFVLCYKYRLGITRRGRGRERGRGRGRERERDNRKAVVSAGHCHTLSVYRQAFVLCYKYRLGITRRGRGRERGRGRGRGRER